MSGVEAVEAPLAAVEAVLNYAVDTGEKPVTHTAVLNSTPVLRTGKREERRATIHNGRPLAHEFSLEREGFVFVRHDTRVKDFYDEDELRSVYYPEIEALVKRESGASRVVIFDHTLRAQDEGIRAERKVREPNRSVHNDYTDWSGPKRVRDILPADEAERLLQGRFAIIQVWQPTNNPVRTNPLAIADARTLRAEELIPSQRSYPGRVGETYQIKYGPEHRWFYFPAMTRNEAVVFKTFDSARDGRARWTAHTSFDDPTSPPDAPGRESIEMRTLAFFEPPTCCDETSTSCPVDLDDKGSNSCA